VQNEKALKGKEGLENQNWGQEPKPIIGNRVVISEKTSAG